jgi:hypothetical protein
VPVSGPVEYRCNWHAMNTPDGPVLIPLRPIAGFLADTAVYGAAWSALLLLPALSPRWWREGRRLRKGCCPACGYDLRWRLEAGCPECAWRPRTTADHGAPGGTGP